MSHVTVLLETIYRANGVIHVTLRVWTQNGLSCITSMASLDLVQKCSLPYGSQSRPRVKLMCRPFDLLRCELHQEASEVLEINFLSASYKLKNCCIPRVVHCG